MFTYDYASKVTTWHFTSGGTEALNWAIFGITRLFKTPKHLVISAIEHEAVIEPCLWLEKQGWKLTLVSPDKNGLITPEAVRAAMTTETVLVAVMTANNEIGTIQPIGAIGDLLKNINKTRSAESKIYFHTDAAQAVNYLDCNVDKLGADSLSLSAHKFYGPKGVGALYIRKGTPIARIQDGGEQEFKLRSGTYNTPGIVGLGKAIDEIKNQKSKIKNILLLRDKLIEGVFKAISNTKLNGSREKRLPNNANFSFPGAEGEAILLSLDLEGIAVSTGSACASENLNPSHVLTALGLGPEDSHSSIRFTLGKYTTEHDIDYVLEVLPRVIDRLRKISGQGKGEAKKKLPDDFGC